MVGFIVAFLAVIGPLLMQASERRFRMQSA
jgi:hypothetical protein